MLLTVGEFKSAVDRQLSPLVDELARLTGRGGEAERNAWRSSLPKLATVLTHPRLDELHLHFARRQHALALEYQLPGASAWCDVVLLGRGPERPAAVVIELKDWDTRQDRPGAWEGLIERRGVQELHPSDQVRGYVRYCQNFHSAVLESAAAVRGCVLFTGSIVTAPYVQAPNEALASEFPIFTTDARDASEAIPAFIQANLAEPDPAFAKAFEGGTFRQDRSFVAQIGAEILRSGSERFELLDNQRQAFALCMARVNQLLVKRAAQRKKVLIVEGPPGSGKSAVAARLWASLVTDPDLPDGNVVLVTTSMSQSSNWTHLIDQAADDSVGRGVARKATSFTPLTTTRLSALRKAFGNAELFMDAKKWREHMAELKGMSRNVAYQPGSEDDSCLISLVDEAHALINPEREHGVGQYGFVTGLGPQAWHIIRASRLSVFFIDPQQSFRARENTSLADIHQWASEQQADVETVSLAGAQFRCAGSAEYVAWVESLLGDASHEVNQVYAQAWRADEAPGALPVGENVIPFPARLHAAESPGPWGLPDAAQARNAPAFTEAPFRRRAFEFEIFANPFEMEEALRRCVQRGGSSVRLLSTYSRPWKTEGQVAPHSAPAETLDFSEPVMIDGKRKLWAKPWNVVSNNDYSSFVQARRGSAMHDDPLCEVGCPYAVRGFDFHYVGLLWLDDLLWRDGKWVVNVSNVHESGIKLIRTRAAHEGNVAPAGPNGEILKKKVVQAYRILLTRAIHGLYIWVPDEQTRKHLAQSLC